MVTMTQPRKSKEADRKAAARRPGRTAIIRPLTNRQKALRANLERSDEGWLRYFFPYPPFGFWYEFTQQQQAMIAAIGHAIRHGGDQAIAASRGEGKTQIARRLALKYAVQGSISFAVLFAATATDASDSLQAIRGDIEDNDLLAELYPEVCDPVLALEGIAQKASSLLCSGVRFDNGKEFVEVPCKFVWCGHELWLPNVPGSPSAGAIIATRGLDSAVRGLNKKGRRPDVAIIDDPDTEDTARSEEQAKKLEERIDRAIGGLGGQQRGIARVMLTTLQNRRCVSYRFTDPMAKPTWRGKRFRFLEKPPARLDMWDEYAQIVQQNLQSRTDEGECADPFCRGAHRFYLENRDAMETGAVVANPHRFDPADLGDGTQLEVSALQRYFNMVARIGQEAVSTEYDNDPPEEEMQAVSNLTPHRIQRQVSGTPRRQIPANCTIITQGIDVRKIALHWTVRAWRPEHDGKAWTGYTIDYGITEVIGSQNASDAGVDAAIIRALRDRREYVQDNPYHTASGEILPVAYTLVDSGWRTEAIYQACDDIGDGWYPAIGHGKSAGCATTNFYSPVASNQTKLIGWRYFLAMRPNGSGWLVHMDADHWKSFEHDRWMTDPEKTGGLLIWGETSGNPDRMSADEKGHHSYARHICAESEVEEPDKQGVMKRYWKAKSDNNHWLDASYRCDVAAAMAGVRMFGMPINEATDDDTEETGQPLVNLNAIR